MSAPYVPAALPTPVPVNPSYGSIGNAIPAISPSQYRVYPTAMSTDNLIPDSQQAEQSNAAAQEAEFYRLLVSASDIVDRICFGASAAALRASLRASFVVEQAFVPVIRGWLRLMCDAKPIIEVRGVDVGLIMGQLSSIGSTLASGIRMGRRTIYVPYSIPLESIASTFRNFSQVEPPNKLTVVWSYLCGYPHSSLAANVTANQKNITLTPNDGASGLYGIYPGTTMELIDPPISESFTVQSIANNVITAVANFQNAHTVPASPDFIPVTALPQAVRLAHIYMVTALLKTRGDASIVWEEVTQPRRMQENSGQMVTDIHFAKKLLIPYMVRIKAAR